MYSCAERGQTDATQGHTGTVCKYSKENCKTCVNIVGHSFSSNVFGKQYNV